MVNSPCLNCAKRTRPKDCERNCQSWKDYRNELAKENEIIKENKYGGIYEK